MVKLEEHKALTEHRVIEKGKLPAKVFIPLLQHLGKPCDMVYVKAGDLVKRGQCLASSESGLFSPVHASISGVVKQICDCSHPIVGFSRAIVIESDGKDEADERMVARRDSEVEALSADILRTIVFESGIVGLGGATFPTHIKLSPKGQLESFILNGAECEPYLTTDHRLMIEKTDEIVKGIRLVLKMINPKNCYIAIEDNKPDAIERMRGYARMFDWKLIVLKSAYPQGGEKQLIKSCLGKEVPSGKLPFDVGALVHNVGTVYAIYEAVYLRKPLYERVVTVTGCCIANPKNILARIGTPVKDLIEQCGPLLKGPKKIVMGGPMTGVAQYTLEGPVIKGTGGIILFDEVEEKEEEESFCVRCGECVDNCPMGLNPGLIAMAINKEKFDLAQGLGIMDCIECGLCAYVCPGRKGIIQAIKTAKMRIRNAKK